MAAPSLETALQQLQVCTRQQLERVQPAPAARVTSLHKDPQWRTGISKMWGHYKRMKGQTGHDICNVWQAWKHMTQFCAGSKRFRAEARQRRKQLLDLFLADAQECAIRGDTSQWYKRVRHICPKVKLESIHLRSAQGALLSPEQSIDALRTYYEALFHDPDYHPVPIPALSCVPFTVADIERAIWHLPVHKATLPELPPALAWRAAASSLAAHIHATLQNHWCTQPFCTIPAEWYKSTLCLLPKPGKSPRSPNNLRPICLQHPICKVLDGLAVEYAQKERPDLLRNLPCFAYIPCRAAEDCLLIAGEHCRQVKTLGQSQ